MKTKHKRMLILILQVVLTIIFAYAVINGVNKKLDPVTVYSYNVSREDLSRPLSAKDITEVEIPKSMMSSAYETDKEKIIGKHVDRKITKGQFIYKDHLVEKEAVDVFESFDLSKYRKISLPISLVEGFSGNIKRGDYIDLAYTGSGATDDGDFIYSKIFQQQVPVWSVNTGSGEAYIDQSQHVSDDLYDDENNVEEQLENSGELAIITLVVTPTQYEEIKARQQAGNISFVGRFDDSKNEETLGFVLGDYEKIFTGEGNAETSRTLIEEDGFEDMIKERE